MSYKMIKPTTLEELTMNVFMLVNAFDPATFDFETGIAGSTILASTTGGVTFADAPEYTDFMQSVASLLAAKARGDTGTDSIDAGRTVIDDASRTEGRRRLV